MNALMSVRSTGVEGLAIGLGIPSGTAFPIPLRAMTCTTGRLNCELARGFEDSLGVEIVDGDDGDTSAHNGEGGRSWDSLKLKL